jgi:hypothetical protein
VGQHYELKEKHSLYLYNYLDFPSRLRILCLIILIFKTYCVKHYVHLAKSLDLNSVEAICSIIKQGLRRTVFDSEEEIKEAIQEK